MRRKYGSFESNNDEGMQDKPVPYGNRPIFSTSCNDSMVPFRNNEVSLLYLHSMSIIFFYYSIDKLQANAVRYTVSCQPVSILLLLRLI